jgi:ADP-ribose pyrophosphatase
VFARGIWRIPAASETVDSPNRSRWKKLVSFCVSPGYVQEKMTIFLATDLTEGTATPMDDERIETRWFTRQEAAGMIDSGRIADAKTIIGYTLWERRGRK